MRITFRMLSKGPLRNIFNSLERVTKLQIQAGSMKRYQVPSDDPVSVMKVLGFRNLLEQNKNYTSNAINAQMYTDTIDSTLRSIKGLLDKAKSIALEQRSDTSSAETRRVAAIEIDGLISDVKDLLNIKFNGKYIFSGHRTQIEPFQEINGHIQYQGDDGVVRFRVGPNRMIDVTVPGSRFLNMGQVYQIDSIIMTPDVSMDTPLADLNNGEGVTPGRFQITDASGNTAVIDITGAATVGDVLNRINNSVPPLDIIAGITTDGDSIAIASTVTGELTVEELDGGHAAEDLGILGTSSGGTLVGRKLNPVLSGSTRLSYIDALSGVLLIGFNVVMNGESYHVDLIHPSYVQTVEALCNRIMESVPGLTAEVNEEGNGIILSSEIPFSVENSNGWTTATDLGIEGESFSFGPFSLFGSLEELKSALQNNDPDALDDIIGKIDGVTQHFLEIVAEVGARGKEIELVLNRLEDDKTKFEEMLASIEQIDLSEVLTKLSEAQIIYEAALKTASQVYRLSLLNYM